MSVEVIGPRPPSAREARTVLEAEAKVAMRETIDHVKGVLGTIAPGSLGRDVRGVVRENTNLEIVGTVAPTGDIWRHVDQGTGIYVEHHSAYGPKPPRNLELSKRAPGTHATALPIGGGKYRRRVKGQKGQHFMQRTFDATEQQAERLMAAGLDRGADKLERARR